MSDTLEILRELTTKLNEVTKDSDKLHRALIQAVGAISFVDRDGKFAQVNEAFAALHGYDPNEMVGMEWRSLTHEEDQGNLNRLYSRMLKKGVGNLECRGIKKDGSIFWKEITSVRQEEDGQVTGHYCFSKDVTPRHEIEEEIRETSARFESAFEYARIGMAIVNTDGKWLRVNDALCKLVGYSSEELLKLDFQSITHPDDLETDLNLMNRLLAGKFDSYELEKRYIHKDGHAIWIGLSVSMVESASGKPMYFISQIRDHDKLKQAQAEVLKLRAELAESRK